MKSAVFSTEQWFPVLPQQVFAFFADAFNLELITPPWLHFQVLTAPPIEMKVGAVIDYQLRLRGFPVRWQSEITEWDPPHHFVDEQRRGPYRRWHHEHTFVECEGGTRAGDYVEYAVPGGVVLRKLLVARDLKKIFAYRSQRLLEVLGEGIR